MGSLNSQIIVLLLALCFLLHNSLAIKCYECSSKSDGQDHCDAYKSFDKDKHIAVECNSDESHTPGTFCMKYVQQSPIGFIWEGRWRQIIRRCASVAESGVTGVCNWGVHENGVYWEQCYCSEDGCNHAGSMKINFYIILAALLPVYFFRL